MLPPPIFLGQHGTAIDRRCCQSWQHRFPFLQVRTLARFGLAGFLAFRVRQINLHHLKKGRQRLLILRQKTGHRLPETNCRKARYRISRYTTSAAARADSVAQWVYTSLMPSGICSVCNAPRETALEINRLLSLPKGERPFFHTLSAQFGISKSAIHRHSQKCLPKIRQGKKHHPFNWNIGTIFIEWCSSPTLVVRYDGSARFHANETVAYAAFRPGVDCLLKCSFEPFVGAKDRKRLHAEREEKEAKALAEKMATAGGP
jgi:hypothetical protein